MKDALIVSLLSLLPRNRSAAGVGWFARTGISRAFTGLFVWAYGVNLDEATGTLADYPTLESLFTRQLEQGARPVDPNPFSMVSPVDGRCAAVGQTVNGCIELAPGRLLDIADLLGETLDSEVDAAVLYLSPTDYHRVHTPREGQVTAFKYTPGTLWPVFPAAVRRVDNLFSRNERMVVHLESDAGPIEVVLVGAFGVGRIEIVCAELQSNTAASAHAETLSAPIHLTRGAELGTFHLGSTVVVVTPPGRWNWIINPGEPVRLGREIAQLEM